MTEGTVQLEPVATARKATTWTDRKGEFYSTTVPVGSYNV